MSRSLFAVVAASALLLARPALATPTPADFATKAAQGEMLEVALGKLVLQKSQNPEVRDFAQMMIDDHTKAGAALAQAAKASGLAVPTTLDQKHQAKVDELSRKGNEFDKDYISYMADDHKEDVEDYSDYAAKGTDANLKTYASDTLATLEKHKDRVDAIKASM